MNQMRDPLITLACRLLSLPFSFLAPRLPTNHSFSSILVIKPCCIGDVILASATLAELRRAYPRARIAFVVSSWAREAIEHNPRVDQIMDCRNLGSGRKFDRKEYMSLVKQVKHGRFELAVVLERSPILSIIPFLAGIPNRAGIDSSGRGFSLTVKAPWHADHHEAELYLDVVRALGISSDMAVAEFYPSDRDREKAESILTAIPDIGNGTRPDRRLALIHPGGAANPGMVLSAKRWPAERYAQLADHFRQDGWTVILVGADSDRPASEAVMASMINANGQSTKVVDLVGKLSLGELGALAQSCQIFVGNDTGPMHIAAAVGAPTVAIFGPSTPVMYAPYGPRSVAVYNKVECSPCFVKGRFATNCRDYKCMRAVEVQDVWQAVEKVLAVR